LFSPAVSPNNDLIFLGGRVTYGQPGFFVAISTAGALLWRIALPTERGRQTLPNSRARFANDGQTVYIGTDLSGEETGNEHCYLYAVPTTSVDSVASEDGAGNIGIGTIDITRGVGTVIDVIGMLVHIHHQNRDPPCQAMRVVPGPVIVHGIFMKIVAHDHPPRAATQRHAGESEVM